MREDHAIAHKLQEQECKIICKKILSNMHINIVVSADFLCGS